MKKTLLFVFSILLCSSSVFAKDTHSVFDVLNLDYKGLETVKKLHEEGKDEEAKEALLTYYKNRTNITHPDLDLNHITIKENEQKWADEALEHKFYALDSHPSYFYGDDINWQYWPVPDNELRWQLHRTHWWMAMARAYHLTKDEKYAKEWVYQYLDWIKKNPLDLSQYSNDDPDSNVDALHNVRFAWRPLEVSHRLQEQPGMFLLFINSPNFTPDFLSEFLINYNRHANHILHNYSKEGNHLLFEAQRMLYAGSLFPELKDAPVWRKSGVDVLLREIEKQILDDGVQYELDLSYHLAAIHIFAKAGRIAELNGFGAEFPQSYYDTIEKMINVVVDTNFPDYTYPLFSDSRLIQKRVMLRDYNLFHKWFPKNEYLKYWASDRKEGKPHPHLSKAYKDGGFYIFRNGWVDESTQMVLKAGPKGEWHNQPDNGTFELYINKRNFFRDSGSFIYGGDEEILKQRAWFKQTRVHNTLTLNNENLNEFVSTCLLWSTSENEDVLVVENQSYPELKHRRSVFFVDQKFFVIVDEAIGTAQGTVGIHFNLSEGDIKRDEKALRATTQYADNNNLLVQTFAAKSSVMEEEEGWVSYRIGKKFKRPAYAINTNKTNDKTTRFITILYPIENDNSLKSVNPKVLKEKFHADGMELKISVDQKKYTLGYKLDK